MTDIPSELKYTKTHEWAELVHEDLIIIGITDHAQKLLGDIVFVELPEVGSQIESEAEFGVIESVKAASDLYSPISGEIVAINSALTKDPGLINKDVYHEGWLIKIQPNDIGEWENLLTAQEYAEKIKD